MSARYMLGYAIGVALGALLRLEEYATGGAQ